MPAFQPLPATRFRLGAWLTLPLCGLLWLLMAGQAQAQSCSVGTGLTMAFGTVGNSGGSTTDNLSFTCQRAFLQPTVFRVCLFLPEGSPLPGINPRRMTNNNGAAMNYDLFSDPAHTQRIGPYGSSFPVHGTTLALTTFFDYSASGQLQVYGQVLPGQSLPATQPYQSQLNNGQLRYSYNTGSFGNPPTAPSLAQCVSGNGADGSGIVSGIYTGVSARFANTCRITTATDLDFGSTGNLSGNRDQTSTLQLQCPTGTSWRIGLDNGNHANGNVRRMAGSPGNYLQYELYRNSGRSQRWGNAQPNDTSNGNGNNAVQSLTVYGRVPAQTAAPGNYSDTVTVTLTY